jgi:hypothetical protein
MLSFLAGSRIGRRGFSPIGKDRFMASTRADWIVKPLSSAACLKRTASFLGGPADGARYRYRAAAAGWVSSPATHGETSEVGSVLRHDDLFLTAFQSSTISSAAFDLGSVSTTPRPVEAAC